MKNNILITGIPGIGKSTLLKKIIQQLNQKIGFVTLEVRRGGERIGFEIETCTGEKCLFADVNFKTNIKVSKYFIDVDNLNKIIPEVEYFKETDFLFIDEIGQMQLFSEKFKNLVLKYLDSQNTCVVTLSKVYSDKFIEKIKERKDVFLIEITKENRNEMEKYIETLLRKISKAKKYCSEPMRFLVGNNWANIKTDHGVRSLLKQKEIWICNCEFFQNNGVCSHVMALEEYFKVHK